jgi:cell division protein FtsZ
MTIPNDNLLNIIQKDTTIEATFLMADDILRQGVQGISDMIVGSGYINADFADVKKTMQNSGVAHMGVGVATGENKAAEAVKGAIESPLLETSINGARNVLVNITGGKKLSMFEANQVMQIANELVDTDADIIFGVVIDESLEDEIRVTVVATGFDAAMPSAKIFSEISGKDEKPSATKSDSGDTFNPDVNFDIDNVDIPPFLKNRQF